MRISDWSSDVCSSDLAMARLTAGVSPLALPSAYLDWGMHLAMAPGKQLELLRKAHRKMTRFGLYAAHCAAQGGHDGACIAPLEQDRRFSDPAWQSPPFNLIYQSFLLTQQWRSEE